MHPENVLKGYNESEVHRKKILALKNFSLTLPEFHEQVILEVLALYLERGLIHKKLHHILDDLLYIHKIDYTLWWDKNYFVKQRIAAKNEEDKNTQYLPFYLNMNVISGRTPSDPHEIAYWSKLYKKTIKLNGRVA